MIWETYRNEFNRNKLKLSETETVVPPVDLTEPSPTAPVNDKAYSACSARGLRRVKRSDFLAINPIYVLKPFCVYSSLLLGCTWSHQNMAAVNMGSTSGWQQSWLPSVMSTGGLNNPTVAAGVAPFPPQLWSVQGASAVPSSLPGLPSHLRLPTATWIGRPTDQLIGAGGVSAPGVHPSTQSFAPGVQMVPPTLLPQSLLHQDWFSSDRSSESKGKRAKHWLRPDFYLPHEKKYDDVSYNELIFGMISVAECLARYNIPQVPVKLS